MGFPLKDWIDAHPSAPHHLAHSGMIGSLRSARRALLDPPDPDADALRGELARTVGVARHRIFLTHGATEGNSLVLVFLAGEFRRRRRGALRARVPTPEYPPIREAAQWAGFRPVRPDVPADVTAISEPNNPTGRARGPKAVGKLAGGTSAVLADETFREFTSAPSLARAGPPTVWTTGTFTKVYGGDDLRVGYVVAPERSAATFARFHGIVADELPPASVAGARALLAHRREILGEVRARFRRNEAALRRRVPDAPPLAAPVWFDRGALGLPGDRLARAAARRGVLVCPGSFFGDPDGVRVCLTQPEFPEDLDAYLRVRSEFVGRRR